MSLQVGVWQWLSIIGLLGIQEIQGKDQEFRVVLEEGENKLSLLNILTCVNVVVD